MRTQAIISVCLKPVNKFMWRLRTCAAIASVSLPVRLPDRSGICHYAEVRRRSL